jgi:hypothetical protein
VKFLVILVLLVLLGLVLYRVAGGRHRNGRDGGGAGGV